MNRVVGVVCRDGGGMGKRNEEGALGECAGIYESVVCISLAIDGH